MEDKSHLTARHRVKLSTPMKYLQGRVRLGHRTLDYGCGRGFDADQLGMDKYDPTFFKTVPTGKYDIVTCIYVLNVVDKPTQNVILENILCLLKDGGCGYVAVRRDPTRDGYTSLGTYNRYVILDKPVFKRVKGSFCIYTMTK